MLISERLTELREKKGLRKTELAKELGIAYGTYNHYEIGDREPNSNTLKLLSEYYGVTLDYLLAGKEKDNNDIYLEKDEKEVLDMYRSATEKAKGMALGILISHQDLEKENNLKKRA